MNNTTMKLTLLLILFLAASACKDIRGEAVDYQTGDMVMKGFLAYDHGMKEKRPGVLVVHEWWGLNDYARKRALMLAELGYTALAVDMYGEGKQALHPQEAGAFAKEVSGNMDLKKARFMAALDVLKNHGSVDPERIAAIGYCFGGSMVLEMARAGVDLDGVVSFHGGLTTANPARPGSVKAKILVCHGEADTFVTPEQIKAFKQEMAQAGADMEFLTYPDATHSFTNPDADSYAKQFGISVGYNRAADEQSWKDMQGFLKGLFQK
ncbi:MAG: dienelactone hydrolase family protein [Nitrospiraceae bacterium]|nr:MAG: dienelactone hydrolase family protein [Nitrospiraceae bacterium]